MESTIKPSITRIARKSGVKCLSDDCIDITSYIIERKLHQILSTAIVVNSEHQTKTLMSDDIYDTLTILGYNITRSSELGTNAYSKF
jgi:histone H3/H4